MLSAHFKHRFQRSFSALSHPSYRIFWFGQMISLIGTWMQSVGQPWLAYNLTHSPFLLGLVGAVQFTPSLLLTLFVGAWIDQVSKRHLILFTQISLAIFAFIYFFLINSGLLQYWHILLIALLQGIVSAVDIPSRHSFMVELVGKSDLMNAIALNSTIFNSARMIGPALAGIVIARYNLSFCFFFNAMSYLPLILGIFFIRPEREYWQEKKQALLKDVGDGLAYIYRQPLLQKTMVILAIVCTFIMNFNVLIPVYAKTVLLSDASGFAYLMSAMGVGSLFGALTMAMMSDRGPSYKMMVTAGLTLAITMVLIGILHYPILSYPLVAIAGFLSVTFLTNANSTVQLLAEDKFRSRVISLYFLITAGSIPFGNLLVGGLSDTLGIKLCLIIIGASVLFLVGIFLLLGKRPSIAPVLADN